jgi:endoglucanase
MRHRILCAAQASALTCILILAGPALAKRHQGAPVNTTPPTISGAAMQGQTLTASPGSWTNSPTSYAYQWQHCTSSCTAITAATGSTYVLAPTDVGYMISVVVTARNAAGSGIAVSAETQPVTASTPPPPAGGLHVSGTHLVDGSGKVLALHGVDRSGTEYACIQGWGVFDGPSFTNDDSQVPLMRAWRANSALIGLNEDCWLGINGVPTAYGGQNYINAIVHETKTLEANGLYPVLSLFWSAPGSTKATGQAAMPDNDHSPAFWQSVANTFKNDPNVVLRLKEEPYPAGNTDSVSAWQCWNAGDVQYSTSNTLVPVSQVSHCSEGYKTVGMQSLINIIRGTGAPNVIQVPGVEYANSMTHFLDSGIRPADTLAPPQLMADVDVYPNGNICGSTSCYDAKYAPVAAQMPFMFGEFGGSVDGSDCTVTAVNALMSWADQHGAGYSAWDWDTWGGCLQLITDYTTGNPDGNWGAAYKNHLASLP